LFNAQYKSLKGDYFAQTDQFENASDAFSMADSVFNTLTFDNVLLKLHLERKSRFFGKTGDYKRAWGANIKLSEINENILNENNRRQVSSLKYKYQRDTTLLAQRNTIALNGQKLKTYRARQFIFIAVLIALILLAGFIYLFFRKKRELQYQQNMRKVATLKMQNLRGRLSPHFLFNVLNNVWASMENKENARHQFDNLSRLIKQSLVNADEISIPLDEEINFVKSFIELQKNGSGSKFTVNWAIEPNLNHIQVPGMILQIPVENAIKHGIQNDLDGLLTIKACKKGHNLLLEVTDNGPGGLAKKPANGTGTGLKVLNSTIYLLNQINSNKMTMKMLEPNSGENTGTKVTITIPLDFNFNLN
jgi:LytS/YehU family sensor histidine kinase